MIPLRNSNIMYPPCILDVILTIVVIELRNYIDFDERMKWNHELVHIFMIFGVLSSLGYYSLRISYFCPQILILACIYFSLLSVVIFVKSSVCIVPVIGLVISTLSRRKDARTEGKQNIVAAGLSPCV